MKTYWIIFKFLMRDHIIQVSVILMINGMFYGVVGDIYGYAYSNALIDTVKNVMYVWVLPAYLWWPRTITPEIVTEAL